MTGASVCDFANFASFQSVLLALSLIAVGQTVYGKIKACHDHT